MGTVLMFRPKQRRPVDGLATGYMQFWSAQWLRWWTIWAPWAFDPRFWTFADPHGRD
jgi:hypothetical protein